MSREAEIFKKQVYRVMKEKAVNEFKLPFLLLFLAVIMNAVLTVSYLSAYQEQIGYYRGLVDAKDSLIISTQNDLAIARDALSILSAEMADLDAYTFRLVNMLEECSEENDVLRDEWVKMHNEAGKYYGQNLDFLDVSLTLAGEKVYDIDDYNCVDFSKDLAHRLLAEGYKARTLRVITDCDSGLFNKELCEKYGGGHVVTVVSIPIEATAGTIIPPSQYGDYNIRRSML